jgi:hypothetical protein
MSNAMDKVTSHTGNFVRIPPHPAHRRIVQYPLEVTERPKGTFLSRGRKSPGSAGRFNSGFRELSLFCHRCAVLAPYPGLIAICDPSFLQSAAHSVSLADRPRNNGDP